MAPTSFPVKLWNVINRGHTDLIRWSDDGREVLVNEDRFKDLIDLYPSFLRQPTLSSLRHLFAVYEFNEEDNGCQKPGWNSYSHPYFVRGRADLMEMFVLSHQTRRYNAKRAKLIGDDCERVCDSVSEYDLQPIDMFALGQFPLTLGQGLFDELDSSATQQSSVMPNNHAEEYITSADFSMIIDTDIDDSHDSLHSQESAQTNYETWMSYMNEDEHWFGLRDQPFAIPVCGDLRQQEDDHTASSYVNLLQMQYCEYMPYA